MGLGRFITWCKRMMEGLGNVFETVRTIPRPSITRLALPIRINPIARRVVQMLIGA